MAGHCFYSSVLASQASVIGQSERVVSDSFSLSAVLMDYMYSSLLNHIYAYHLMNLLQWFTIPREKL